MFTHLDGSMQRGYRRQPPARCARPAASALTTGKMGSGNCANCGNQGSQNTNPYSSAKKLPVAAARARAMLCRIPVGPGRSGDRRSSTGSGNCGNAGNPRNSGRGRSIQPVETGKTTGGKGGNPNASCETAICRNTSLPGRIYTASWRRTVTALGVSLAACDKRKALIFRAFTHLFAGAVCLTPHRGSYISRAPLGALRGRSSVG